MGWIIFLCVVAVVFIIAALIRARRSYRRGSPESPPELAGQWEARHVAKNEAGRFNPPSAKGYGR